MNLEYSQSLPRPLPQSFSPVPFSNFDDDYLKCNPVVNLNIEELLSKDIAGKMVLSQYEKNECLSKETRKILVDKIIKHILTGFNV